MFRNWFKSAAGKVSLTLFIISLVLLIIVFLPFSFLDKITTEYVNNILISSATGLIGIIITVAFVQYFIDSQNQKQELQDEKEVIKRHSRMLNILIDRYILCFYCVTTPISIRAVQDYAPECINKDFKFEEIYDLYKPSLFIHTNVATPSIVLFNHAEKSLREYLVQLIGIIPFKYHQELLNIFIKFIEVSLNGEDVINTVSSYSNNKDVLNLAEKSIQDTNERWVERFDNGELKSNLLILYVLLYKILKEEQELIISYKEIIKKMITND